ncbi:MAG: hypothetical protein ACRC3B_04365 [Bacteroidia bacterium]
MKSNERNLVLILTGILFIQPFLGLAFSANDFDSVLARVLIYAHLTIEPLSTDLPLSKLMGPVLALLVLLCSAGGAVQLLLNGKTAFLRALMIFTFIWILLRGALYIVILPGSDERWPLVIGILAMIAWGWIVTKVGNPLFRKTRSN